MKRRAVENRATDADTLRTAPKRSRGRASLAGMLQDSVTTFLDAVANVIRSGEPQPQESQPISQIPQINADSVVASALAPLSGFPNVPHVAALDSRKQIPAMPPSSQPVTSKELQKSEEIGQFHARIPTGTSSPQLSVRFPGEAFVTPLPPSKPASGGKISANAKPSDRGEGGSSIAPLHAGLGNETPSSLSGVDRVTSISSASASSPLSVGSQVVGWAPTGSSRPPASTNLSSAIWQHPLTSFSQPAVQNIYTPAAKPITHSYMSASQPVIGSTPSSTGARSAVAGKPDPGAVPAPSIPAWEPALLPPLYTPHMKNDPYRSMLASAMQDPFKTVATPAGDPYSAVKADPGATPEIPKIKKRAGAAKREAKVSQIIDISAVPCVQERTIVCGKRLLPHQCDGINWMFLQERCPASTRGGILADDVGLGKTIQSVALISLDTQRLLTLLVVPKSVTEQWQRELLRTKNTRVFSVVANATLRGAMIEMSMNEDDMLSTQGRPLSLKTLADWSRANGDPKERTVVVCSYGMCRSVNSFPGVLWDRIIMDEAHLMRNAATKGFKSMAELERDDFTSAWALTATPIVNRIGELLAVMILSGFNPAQPAYEKIVNKYLNMATFKQDTLAVEPRHIATIHELWQSHAMRRTMRDVSLEDQRRLEFPDGDPIITEMPVPFRDEEEAAIYLRVISHVQAELTNVQREKGPGSEILRLIALLRLLCVHPNLAVKAINKRLKLEGMAPWPQWKKPTSKNIAVVDHVRKLKEQRENVLIFTHFYMERDYFEAELEALGYQVFQITGDMESTARDSVARRTREIPTFQTLEEREYQVLRDKFVSERGYTPFESDERILRQMAADEAFPRWQPLALLVSIRAGGAGLNLQHFSQAVIPSPDWTSVAYTQAIGRLFRFGQKRQVHVVKMYIPEVKNASEQLELRMKAREGEKEALINIFVRSTPSEANNFGASWPSIEDDIKKLTEVKAMRELHSWSRALIVPRREVPTVEEEPEPELEPELDADALAEHMLEDDYDDYDDVRGDLS